MLQLVWGIYSQSYCSCAQILDCNSPYIFYWVSAAICESEIILEDDGLLCLSHGHSSIDNLYPPNFTSVYIELTEILGA